MKSYQLLSNVRFKMPKTKKGVVSENKEIILDSEDKAIIDDPELIAGDVVVDEEAEEDDAILTDEEVDPFKDRWEE